MAACDLHARACRFVLPLGAREVEGIVHLDGASRSDDAKRPEAGYAPARVDDEREEEVKRDIFEYRAKARLLDLANRSYEPEVLTIRLDSVTDCDCGSPLLVTDSGTMCRQCVLQARMTNPMPRVFYNGKVIIDG